MLSKPTTRPLAQSVWCECLTSGVDRLRVRVQIMACFQKACRRPCLKGLAHGPARFAMVPFVELPFLGHTQRTKPGKLDKFPSRKVSHAQLVNISHPESADKRPDASVVVVVG